LQAIYGDITPFMEPPKEYQEKMRNRTLQDVLNADDVLAECSPLMLFYPLLLIGAIVLGFRLRQLRTRRAILGGLAGTALFLLLLQTAAGFPLERRVNNAQQEMAKQERQMQERRRQFQTKDDPFAAMDTMASRMAAAIVMDVRYTGWYWIALLCHLAALVALALEGPQTERRIERLILAWQDKSAH
jgi:hypothetical protein